MHWSETHDLPTHTRLNEHYFAALKRLAKQQDIPVATLSRSLLIQALDRILAEQDKGVDTS